MNGGYTNSAFDFIDNFNYGVAASDNHDRQPNHYLHNLPLFDPLVTSISPLFPYTSTYNSTGTTHNTFLPPVDTTISHFMHDPHMIQQQHQYQQYNPSIPRYTSSSSTTSPYISTLDSLQPLPENDNLLLSGVSNLPLSGLFPDQNVSNPKQADKARKENPDLWLESMKIKCTDVSLEPLSGTEILSRVRSKTDEVVTRFLPCVEFLVTCQQDLRAGLAAATQKRLIRNVYRDVMTPKEFYKRYLAPLPEQFFQRNCTIMEGSVLNDAVEEINKLCQDSRRVDFQGCEMMKNTFLGGMKDGESWGLRKWLSKHGGALQICNDLECILRSVQELDKSQDSTRKLCERLRPLAKQALGRLKNDVPTSYQEISTAHPYLPFFHRLESALKAMSNFDPDDDDVIVIDDDDEIEVIQSTKPTKRQLDEETTIQDHKKQRLNTDDAFEDLKPSAVVDDEKVNLNVIEIDNTSLSINNGNAIYDKCFHQKEWKCPQCTMLNAPSRQRCIMCDRSIDGCEIESEDDSDSAQDLRDFPFGASDFVPPILGKIVVRNLAKAGKDFNDMITEMENIAKAADHFQLASLRPPNVAVGESFWDVGPQFAGALRLVLATIQHSDARGFFNPVDDMESRASGLPPFSSMIKHPICLRDIVYALIGSKVETSIGNGQLPVEGLSHWNMWRGMDLLQAIDLVLLNFLAYNGKEKTKMRSTINKLRKSLWDGIHEIIERKFGKDIDMRKCHTPTRRGENSGFVIRRSR
jgi:hypothetical protein